MKEQRIDTIEELEKEVDNLIVLYRYNNYCRMDIMLIMKFKSVKKNFFSLCNGVRYFILAGDDAVILFQYGMQDFRFYEHLAFYYSQQVLSIGQTYIRKPTSEEIKSYKNLLRYRKIFGKSPNPSQLNIYENK